MHPGATPARRHAFEKAGLEETVETGEVERLKAER